MLGLKWRQRLSMTVSLDWNANPKIKQIKSFNHTRKIMLIFTWNAKDSHIFSTKNNRVFVILPFEILTNL